MGAAKVVPSDRSKSHLSYYVAMGVIIGLLIILCCYACYFFINKFIELSASDSPSTIPSTCPKKEPVSYPVQPVVRDSATAMAALCRQLLAGYSIQGDQIFPSGRSPDPLPALTSPQPSTNPQLPTTNPQNSTIPPTTDISVEPVPDKVPEVFPVVPCIVLETVK